MPGPASGASFSQPARQAHRWARQIAEVETAYVEQAVGGVLEFTRGNRDHKPNAEPRMSRGRRRVMVVGILPLACILPSVVAYLTTPAPQTRRIHIELFRYGSEPATIRVNRGDLLILTFSARDTAHSFLLQEYDLDVKVSPNTNIVQVVHPSRPEDDPQAMTEVVFKAGLAGLRGLLATKSRYRCHVFCGKMHAFEQGVLVVRPNYLFVVASGVLVAIPLIGWLLPRQAPGRASPAVEADAPGDEAARALPAIGHSPQPTGVNLLQRWRWLNRLFLIPGLQFWLMALFSLLMYIVLLTSLLGTTMAGGNFGVMLMWVVWIFALLALFIPLGGRAWCTVCPLPMLGDALQRGSAVTVRAGQTGSYNNILRGLMRRWPDWLSSSVTRTLVFHGFAMVAVVIVSQPRWTGWAVLSLLIPATLLPLVFELRVFCRYLCPVNSFVSIYATMGRLALRANKSKVCSRCQDRDLETCLYGNERGWACPYGVSVAELDRNNDCGLCMECIRSCSFENIGLYWRPFGLERILSRRDHAYQATVMLTLGVVYCVMFEGPWHRLRDMVNIVDKGNWGKFGLCAVSLSVLALVLIPLLFRASAQLGRRLGGSDLTGATLAAREASALVPMGLFVWIGFATHMLMVQGSFVVSTVSDPFGWGWNLFGTAGQPWWQIAPEAIPWIQTGLILVALALGLRTLRRVWQDAARNAPRTLYGMLPTATLLMVLAGGLVWFIAG